MIPPQMTKTERFMAVIRGEPVDHLPITAWVHFASEHLSPDETATLHKRFFDTYDWDYLKAMNDYRYPLGGSEDLNQLHPLGMAAPNFSKQLTMLHSLRLKVGADVPIVETLFDPLQTLVRAAGQVVHQPLFAEAGLARQALEVVTHDLMDYIHALKAQKIDGLFLSVNGAVQPAHGGLTDEQFTNLVTPYCTQLLQAAEGMVRIIHVHGFNLAFDRTLHLPAEGFSWSHRATSPSLAQARQLTDKALLGGIDETTITRQSIAELTAGLESAVHEAGSRKLLLAPGCTVPSDTPQRLLLAASLTAKNLR